MNDLQAKLTHFNTHWDAIKEEMIRHAGALNRFRGNEQAVLEFTEREDYLYSSLYGYKFDLHQSLRDVATNIVGGLVRIAADHWSGASRLNIEMQAYRTRFLDESDRDVPFKDSKLAKFHPSHVWAALEADFGGNKGEEQGFQQAAQQIIGGFRIHEGDTMPFKAGCYQLNISMYLDSIDKKWGRNRYSYSCKEGLGTLANGLEVFMRWADNSHGGMRVRQELFQVARYHDDVEPRKKYICDDELMFITYQNRIEVRFSKALGEKLQVFLGLYGSMLPKVERWYA